MVALPCCHVTLSGNRRDRQVRPAVLERIGDHVRERRLDLGLEKKQLATQLGVDETTVHNWEDKGVIPAIRLMPRIIDFLGYCPVDRGETQTLGQRLKNHRARFGLSRKKLAALIRTDESNLAGWENGKHQPTKRSLSLINEFLLWKSVAEK